MRKWAVLVCLTICCARAPVDTGEAVVFTPPLTVLKDAPGVTIAAPPAVVWDKLPEAYASVGLLVFASDPAIRTLTSAPMRGRRRFEGEPVETFLECPGSHLLYVAYEQEVRFRVQSTVEPGPNGTSVVRTALIAAAKLGNDSYRCASTYRLEEWIATYIKDKTT